MKEVQPQKDKWSIALYYFILLLSKSISLNFRMHASVYEIMVVDIRFGLKGWSHR
jgi:hypothetical protein